MNRLHVRFGVAVVTLLLIGAGSAWARPAELARDQAPVIHEGHGALERAVSWLLAVFGRVTASMDPSGNDAVTPPPTSPQDPDPSVQ